jgi:AraC-like DNA-binding protein
MPLASVALECGFADQSHLTRRFKGAVGVTPAAWRRTG